MDQQVSGVERVPATRDHYDRNGYVISHGLIPRSLIDNLLAVYGEEILPSRYPFFRQNTNAYEPNKVTEFGYVRQSFLDIHDYNRFARFSACAREIFCSDALIDEASLITGASGVRLMQTMLFDLNAETPAHQDWYYLDSVPNGHLVGAWIALEDIAEDAGRFFVVPGSHTLDFDAARPGKTHAEWLREIGGFVQAHPDKIAAPALQAGDVLFWNSRTVHGSLPTRNPRYSRKSLTAHFLPEGYEFGNLFSVKDGIQYKRHGRVDFYRNQPDFSLWNWVKFSIKVKAYNSPALREGLRRVRKMVSV